MQMLELIDSIASGESRSSSSILSVREDGVRVRGREGLDSHALLETAKFLEKIEKGKLPLEKLREAMSTSDFPLLFADILDRQLLGYYTATQPTWRAYAREGTVPDFRNVKRFAVDGAESTLSAVPELTEYPEASLTESKDEYSVAKYGRRIDLSWEAMVNDDLDAFRRTPQRLATAARRSESKFATKLFVDANGPHASLYKAEYGNVVTGNPVLSIESLQKAFTILAAQTDTDGEPIVMDMVTLVVPPALKIVAENILHATELRLTANGAVSNQELIVANWMRNNLQLAVEPYIPNVATAENGSTSWFLFASPSTGRPALEFGFLRGYEEPSLYERAPDARRVGGGGDVNESFTDDSIAWRVRHVFGGTRLTSTGGAKATVASSGKGS